MGQVLTKITALKLYRRLGRLCGGMGETGECVLGLKKGEASKLVQLWDV